MDHDLHTQEAFELEWKRLLDELPRDLQLPAWLRDAHFLPRVSTTYRRRSFRSDDRTLRLTIDSELALSSPALVARAPGQFRPPMSIGFGGDRIVEVKSVDGVPAWLGEAIRTLPEQPEFSKFRWGVATLFSEAK